jgi:hypothetical protein
LPKEPSMVPSIPSSVTTCQPRPAVHSCIHAGKQSTFSKALHVPTQMLTVAVTVTGAGWELD